MSRLFFIFLLNLSTQALATGSRFDLSEVTDVKVRGLADATVALVHKEKIESSLNGSYLFSARSFGDRFNLCPSEPFREQKSLAFCSGSLIGPDTILTAGHCVESEDDCGEILAVFGFDGGAPTSSSASEAAFEVYRCVQVIHSEDTLSGSDFALLRLDRAVTGHRPLLVRQKGTLQPGASLVMIGHPSGLPTKVSFGDADSTSMTSDPYFVAHIDASQGSSGSPVFNLKTGLIEGVLARGGDDFITQNYCMVSNPCLGESCDGEDVTRVSQVLPYLAGTKSPDEEVTFSEVPANDVGVLHNAESPCAHSLSNLKALCSF